LINNGYRPGLSQVPGGFLFDKRCRWDIIDQTTTMTNIQFIPSAISAGECVSNAWEMLKRNYGMYLGIGLIAIILTGCIPCLNVFIMGPVMGGVYYVALRDMRGEPVEFGMMFKGFEKFVPLMIIGLIQSIPGIIAQFVQYGVRFAELGIGNRDGDFQFFQSGNNDLAIASGIMVFAVVIGLIFVVISVVWWAVFFFAVPLVIEYDLNAIDAIKLSARAAMNNLGGMIVLMLLQMLISLLGLLMICLGVFLFSIPLIFVTNAFVYRQVFPWLDRQFNTSPPPPTAYGFGGGQYT